MISLPLNTTLQQYIVFMTVRLIFFFFLTKQASFIILPYGVPGDSVVENVQANGGDLGSIPGSGRSPREGNDNLL